MDEAQPQPVSSWWKGSGISPSPMRHELTKDVNKVVGRIAGGGRGIRKTLNGNFERQGSEQGAVLIHCTFPKCSLSPYLMSGTTLGSGDVNMTKICSCSQEVEKTGKVSYSRAKASWRK